MEDRTDQGSEVTISLPSHVAGSGTDTYLQALARHRGGQLATLDRRLSVKAVMHGKEALHLIPSGKAM